ncbi:hypothetical protein MINTMi27_15780 [Mycobacterium intracellulare]|uniref:hypothetical protein n=1 Tax=Mycobacterium intracellulare TaxID=1767 RepID=UPI0019274CC2|nr:hypothetical protein [Mycobacterium intracellulare]BCP41485.1 hypothetical protein MINTMi27_15780 [Mycobacterium intracellulare]
MSEFTAFVQRPEKVDAFQFNGPHQVEHVLSAFGADQDHFTLSKEGPGKYRLSFQNPKTKGVALAPGFYLTSPGGMICDQFGRVSPCSGNVYSVVTGSWVVRRYVDTDHPEIAVLADKAFRQKYQASIEAA